MMDYECKILNPQFLILSIVNKHFTLVLSLVFCTSLHAQKTIDGMIAAEKAFAQYALDKNTKQAFLKFMDMEAVQFTEGKPIKTSDF